MKLTDHLKTLSHHAYCIVGSDTVRTELISILESAHLIPAKRNQDFFEHAYDTFTIDSARELKSMAEMRPVTAVNKKVFILSMNSITIEAQNALLKLLEEPPAYAHFFLIVPSSHMLAPTVVSRLYMIDRLHTSADGNKKNSGNRELIQDVTEFLELSVPKRLEYVKKLVDDISKEKKTKQDAIDFLNACEECLYAQGIRGNKEALKVIDTARMYMHDRAPSLKMLLEYVAMNVIMKS